MTSRNPQIVRFVRGFGCPCSIKFEQLLGFGFRYYCADRNRRDAIRHFTGMTPSDRWLVFRGGEVPDKAKLFESLDERFACRGELQLDYQR